MSWEHIESVLWACGGARLLVGGGEVWRGLSPAKQMPQPGHRHSAPVRRSSLLGVAGAGGRGRQPQQAHV